MKKTILALIATAMLTTATAQTTDNQQKGKRPDPKEMVEKRTQEMTKKYGLNAEQAAKVKALNEKFTPKGGPNRGKKKGERPEPKDGKKPQYGGKNIDGAKTQGKGQGRDHRGRPNMEQYNKELQQIMTPEQYKAYTADMEKRRAERKERKASK